jgi:hypothetical protein
MDAHEYVFFFQNLNILCIFSDRFFSGSGSVPVFWVDRFNNRSGPSNLGQNPKCMGSLARSQILK